MKRIHKKVKKTKRFNTQITGIAEEVNQSKHKEQILKTFRISKKDLDIQIERAHCKPRVFTQNKYHKDIL